ncbi:MAG: hypothetical protein H7A12_13310 [Pseudomonadales bacterium]|jgi:hypothetical protein|nr:hypothetical protein [Pseudomonadales bacterium]MCP5321784.1 hypothetical protein [Pseudomonadales bacterium]
MTALRSVGRRKALVAGSVLLALLGGCLAPAMLLPSSSQLMWALLTPLVGFDPNRVNLFEQPVLRNRMVALLGEHYDPTMRLLRTANELRREGPLFYVVSRYTPIPEMADKAGLVWNADTNQLAVALLKGDVTQVLSERVEAAVDERVAAARDAALEGVEGEVEGARDSVAGAVHEAAARVLPVWPAEMAWANPREAIRRTIEHEVHEHADEMLDPANREEWEAPDEVLPDP